MRSVLIILAILFATSYAQFSLSCTVECAAYWTCYARAAWTKQPAECPYPQRCECKKPFWMKDGDSEEQSDKTLREIQQKLAKTESDFSLKCTVGCGKYYVCKAAGAWKGDYSECVSPAGCECRKFAWEKDTTESDAQFLKKVLAFAKKVAPKVKKGIEIYKKVKGSGILADKIGKKQPIITNPVWRRKYKHTKKMTTESDQLFEKVRNWFTSLKNKLQKKTDEEQADQLFEKIRNWFTSLKNKLQKKADDEEQADQFLEKVRNWFTSLKNKLQRKADDEEQADQIFEKIRNWFTSLKNKLQKKADDEEQAEQFFQNIRNWFTSLKNKLQKKADDDEQADQALEKVRNWFTSLKNRFLRKADDEEQAEQFFQNIRNWFASLKNKLQKKADDEEQAEQFFQNLRNWINNRMSTLKNKLQKKADDEEQAEQFFQNLRNWVNDRMSTLKKTFQKKADDEEQSDAEGFNCGQAYERGVAIGRKMCTTINGKPVVEATAAAFNRMKAAASKAGVSLSINSGFRTQKEQQYFYNCYLTKKCNNGNLAAKPGYSNHQNGKALDISVINSKVYNWLTNNASKFGFVRTVPSEKWHWELRNTRCNAFVSYSCK